MTVRGTVLWIHRWTGLAMAAFLVAAGVSGSVLVFQNQLDAWLNPQLYRAPAVGDPLPAAVLAARIEAADPAVRAANIPLRVAPGEAARIGVAPRPDPATGKPFAIDYDQVFVDPVSGAILGRRESEDALIPQIYEFHYTLLAPDGLGKLALGIVAIVWTINCFVGLYLTLPRRRPFLRGWKPAWILRTDIGAYRLNFDLHRAGGLWLWLVLLPIAFSSIYMNLNFELFRPALALVWPLSPNIYERDTYRPRLLAVRQRGSGAGLGIDQVVALARAEVQRTGQSAREPSHIAHFPPLGVYRVLFHPSQFDRGNGPSPPILYFDDRDGSLFNAAFVGGLSAGDEVLRWQFALHSGRILGWPGRLLVFAAGIATAMLSVTGVYVWLVKRRRSRRRPPRAAA